jgi:hypothetical protein
LEVFIDVLLKRFSDGSGTNARGLARTVHANRVVCEKRHHGGDVSSISGVNGLPKDCDRIVLSESPKWEHCDAHGEKYG